MDAVIGVIRWSHIALGAIGLLAFWVPIVTKKGGARHKQFGMIFALCAYFVSGSAMVTPPLRIGRALAAGASVTENAQAFGFLIFLFYLGLVTFAFTRQAVQTVRTRRDPDSIRTPFHLVVGVAPTIGSIMVLVWALTFWSSFSVVMLAFAPLGVFLSAGILKYAYRRPREKRAWFYAHMGAMLGAGIAFHTAFFVFGSRALIDLSLFGPFNWVPWVLPALIGVSGNRYWETHYRRKFGDLADAGARKATAPA